MVTMKDVAREAGVSRPTVSMVLNGRESTVRISKSTREHILNTAERIGYRRNVLATSVRTGKTNIIGFIGGISEEYAMKEVEGINQELAKQSYLLKLLPLEWGKKSIKPVARQCVEQMLSGVICRALLENQLEELHQELAPHNIPIVLIDNSFSHDWCPRVVSDDFNGERMAVKHLHELGHRRIAHITSNNTCGFILSRKQGFEAGMKECGLEVSESNFAYTDHLIGVTENTLNAFEDIMNNFRPTAITFSSDPNAMKFMQWTYKKKIRIPDDISVVGFANLDLTRHASPGLTTIEQPFEEMGRRTASKILNMVRNKAMEKDEFLPVKLIVRDSTTKI